MPYIEPEIIEQVRQIDLLTYLRKFEPDNVEEVKGTKNVLELSWDEWMMNIEVEDMEDSIKKVAELLRERKI